MKAAREFVARRADLIGVRRGQNRRGDLLGAFILEPVQPHVGPRPQDVGINLMRQIFDVEHALAVDGHFWRAFGSRYSCCFFYRRQFYRTPAVRRHRAATQGTGTMRHVDNTGDRVKFRRLDEVAGDPVANERCRKARENSMAPAERPMSSRKSHRPTSDRKASDGKTSGEKASHEQAWHDGGAGNLQAQRHPAGTVCARPRADDTDPDTSRRSVLHDLSHRPRRRSGRHRLRRVDGRHARRRADADQRLCDLGKRAGLTGRPLSDSADHAGVRTRHARRVQLRAIAGMPYHAAGARLAGDGASHRDAARRIRIRRRSIDQAGDRDTGAGGAHSVAASDRRQGFRDNERTHEQVISIAQPAIPR